MNRTISEIYADYNQGREVARFRPWVYQPGQALVPHVIPDEQFQRTYKLHQDLTQGQSKSQADIWVMALGNEMGQDDFFYPSTYAVKDMQRKDIVLMHPFFEGTWSEEGVNSPWISSTDLGAAVIDIIEGCNFLYLPMLRAYVQSLIRNTPNYRWHLPTRHMNVARTCSPLHWSQFNITYYHIIDDAVAQDKDALQQVFYSTWEWLDEFKQGNAPQVIFLRDLVSRLDEQNKTVSYDFTVEKALIEAAYPEEGMPFRVEYLTAPGQLQN